jgi:hypothetical protein
MAFLSTAVNCARLSHSIIVIRFKHEIVLRTGSNWLSIHIQLLLFNPGLIASSILAVASHFVFSSHF